MQMNPLAQGEPKLIGYLTFTEQYIAAVPKVFPVYENGSPYEYFTLTADNFIGTSAVFCIGFNKVTQTPIGVTTTINNGAWQSFTQYAWSYKTV